MQSINPEQKRPGKKQQSCHKSAAEHRQKDISTESETGWITHKKKPNTNDLKSLQAFQKLVDDIVESGSYVWWLLKNNLECKVFLNASWFVSNNQFDRKLSYQHSVLKQECWPVARCREPPVLLNISGAGFENGYTFYRNSSFLGTELATTSTCERRNYLCVPSPILRLDQIVFQSWGKSRLFQSVLSKIRNFIKC